MPSLESFEPPGTLTGRQIEGRVEKATQTGPVLRRQIEVAALLHSPLSMPIYFSASARNKRACCQSRRTVRSVTCSAAATSASVRPPK